VLSAGGVAGPAEVRDRLEAGAEGVVAGTRFLMSEESGAHPEYKERLLGARETVLTELFGLGWPAPHRVVPNPATDRWLRGDRRGPAWVRAIHRMSAFGASRVPSGLQLRLAASQRPSRPLFGPAAATADGPRNLVDAGPLYAGKSIERIADIRPAAVLVRELAS
jgi:nitronate monooxygenase